jgi:YVTN family beta-propeller protein
VKIGGLPMKTLYRPPFVVPLLRGRGRQWDSAWAAVASKATMQTRGSGRAAVDPEMRCTDETGGQVMSFKSFTAGITLGLGLVAASTFAIAGKVFIADQGSDTVTVIDVVSFKKLAIIPVGRSPHNVQVAPDAKRLWVKQRSAQRLGTAPKAAGVAPGAIAQFTVVRGDRELNLPLEMGRRPPLQAARRNQ